MVRSSYFTQLTSPTHPVDWRGFWVGAQLQPSPSSNSSNSSSNGSNSSASQGLSWQWASHVSGPGYGSGSGSVGVSDVLPVLPDGSAATLASQGAQPGACGVVWLSDNPRRYSLSGLACNSTVTRFSYLCALPGRLGPDPAVLSAAYHALLLLQPSPPPPAPPPSPQPPRPSAPLGPGAVPTLPAAPGSMVSGGGNGGLSSADKSALIGGVVGGVVGLALLSVLAILLYERHTR